MQVPGHILRTLEALVAQDRLRTLPQPQAEMVDFCSNDYLGLGRTGFMGDDMAWGAGGARLLAGTHPAHLNLEALCASHFQGEAALLFNSGYQANVGLLSALGQRGDAFLYDEACHASLKDGMRLSMAGKFSFRHQDLHDLERLLQQAAGNRYIVVEALYSMDGDWCDLQAILELAARHGAWVIVDEAHSTGIVGPSGAGLSVGEGVSGRVLARIHTFGKAVGRMGAVVVGPQALIDFLVNRSRAWIYSTAMPGVMAASIVAAITVSRSMEAERARLVTLRRCLETALREESGAEPVVMDSPIYPLVVPGNGAVKSLAARVRAAGYDVRAVLSPTVPEGKERLRIVLHAFNTEEEAQGLARAIGRW